MKIQDLIEFADNGENIADELKQEELDQTGEKVRRGYDLDESSREQWKAKNDEAVKLAMLVEEMKSDPWPGAANVKYPLVATASVQFSSRVMPSIIKDWQVVKAKVIGDDMDGSKRKRADRVSNHMSYQLVEEMEDWIDDMDRLLTSLPVMGCLFKKTYFCPNERTNSSIRLMPDECVVNYFAKSLEKAPRVTHVYELYPNDIEERKRNDIFLDIDFVKASSKMKEGDNRGELEEEAPHVFLEQHRWLDLDDDGYQEPYIVTTHKDSSKVARIIARFDEEDVEFRRDKVSRINPVHYFTKFGFIPSIDGSIYDTGFGHLLAPMNKTINQTVNQLLDAGTLSNLQSGFLGRGIQLGRSKDGGMVRFKPGEWKHTKMLGDDLRKNIFPLPVRDPSLVLFQLLGLMVESGEKLSSVTEVLMGESPGAEVPATTTLALIEQGLKVFGAIFGRVYRSLKSEYRKLYRLNRLYLNQDTYFSINDDAMAVAVQDYNSTDHDIVPIANPNEVSDTQKLVKAQALMAVKGQGFNDPEINKRFADALDVPDKTELLTPPPPQPDPTMVLEEKKLAIEAAKAEMDIVKTKYEIMEIESKIIKNLAEAEAKEAGPQMEQYKAEMKLIEQGVKNAVKMDTGASGSVGKKPDKQVAVQ